MADWNILIRTLETHSGPEKWHATVQAGGGVVIDRLLQRKLRRLAGRRPQSRNPRGASGLISENDLPERSRDIPRPNGGRDCAVSLPGLREGMRKLEPSVYTRVRSLIDVRFLSIT